MTPTAKYEPEQASFEEFRIMRSICDGQRGYTTIWPTGARLFHFSLHDAFRDLLQGLGHKTDRDIIVVGEPEEGNVW